MGLEDRDWYREEPSKAWRNRWRAAGGGTSARVLPGAWLAIAVSVAITAAAWKLDVVDRLGLRTPPRGEARVVRLSRVVGLDTVASKPKQWTLSDPRFGTVTIVVPVGSTPRQAFVNALAERGFQVVG